MRKISLLKEDIGKTGDNNIGFGVKGEFKVHKNDKGVVNPYTKIIQDDKMTLSQVSEKLTTGIQMFTELYQYLDQYGKLNPDPIQTVINQLKNYQEAIDKEINSLK